MKHGSLSFKYPFPCVVAPHFPYLCIPKIMTMWFFNKKKNAAVRAVGPVPDAVPWKERYLELLVALGDMYPYGMTQLLSEAGEEREFRWQWDDWVQTIGRHQDYIFSNIGRIRSLEKQTFIHQARMLLDLPTPSVILENVVKVRSMVEGWERTERLGLPYFALADYIPSRVKGVGADVWDVRNLVWHFKCDIERTTPMQHAEAMQTVLERMAAVLQSTFGPELQGLTLVCIPASSTVANDVRFAEFAERLCHATGMKNAHGHLRIIGRKKPKHLGRGPGVKVELDNDWFRYRKVLFIDDIITTGGGYEFQAELMRVARAFVIGAVFIGHTIGTDDGSHQ